MTRYRNTRKDMEDLATEQNDEDQKFLAEPAKTVEDEMWKKRYGDLRRHTDKAVNEAKERADELERKLDAALRGQLKAPKSDADVEAWVKEYPEFAGILETIVQKRITEATASTTKKLAEIETEKNELNAERAYLELKKKHKDLDELTKNPEFHSWLQSQSQRYQDAIYNALDVDEASFVIDKYKASTKKSKVDDEDDFSNTDAAKVVRKSVQTDEPSDEGDYEFTESQIEREARKNPRWFDKNEEKIMEAARKGKILMDVSGGAR